MYRCMCKLKVIISEDDCACGERVPCTAGLLWYRDSKSVY